MRDKIENVEKNRKKKRDGISEIRMNHNLKRKYKMPTTQIGNVEYSPCILSCLML